MSRAYPQWYTKEEIADVLRRMDYSPFVIAELAPWFYRHILSSFNRGFRMGCDSLQGDNRILWGVVANAGRLSNRRRMCWEHVMDTTGMGSQSSIELCRRFGFDPDEIRPARASARKEG